MTTRRRRIPDTISFILAFSLTALLPVAAGRAKTHAEIYRGIVVDGATSQAISGATVTLGGNVAQSGPAGEFEIEGQGSRLGIRAQGYLRRPAPAPSGGAAARIELHAFSPRAVYMSSAALADPAFRQSLARLANGMPINALVIDVKDDNGALSLAVPAIAGATRGDGAGSGLSELIRLLRERGIYTIARVVVFKDGVLARARPRWALRSPNGNILREGDKIPWTDPRKKEVRDYNVAVAVEAAKIGFDEIQFDYIRFPSLDILHEAMVPNEDARRVAIRGFLAEARAALAPYNVFVAADLFGYAIWDRSDTHIGQTLEDFVSEVDYVCPMLYPSGFAHGLPAARAPLDRPDTIVALSLRRAQLRSGIAPSRFRPWLQAFGDYRFDRRPFHRNEIAAQTRAADSFGPQGWMLWHPDSIYAPEDVQD